MRRVAISLIALMAAAVAARAGDPVPNEIRQPGTQPGEVFEYLPPTDCDFCHTGITQTINPGMDLSREPGFGWYGGMMGNATRDPLFWAAMAIAEQDFPPDRDWGTQRGGVGDLCLRCHATNGWIAGRATPPNGSGLDPVRDVHGVECEFCHLLVDPDPPVNIVGTVEVQNPPFEAYDPVTGEPYRGSGEYVINGNGIRLGPYQNSVANHQVLPSPFMRSEDLCGTCHDVSNPAVGDLAPGHGAFAPFTGTFGGTFGSKMEQKAAFNNAPYTYGVVERTFSEWESAAIGGTLVSDYGTLPADLRDPAGAIAIAYQHAAGTTGGPDYEDGTPRYFTCQTCHMPAAIGEGSSRPNSPTRTDLPRHDLTGGSYWMPDALQYMDGEGTLRLGGGFSQLQRDALDDAKTRAEDRLRSAASLSASLGGGNLTVRVTNLTGHKLFTGYPEGRRMWLNVRWLDGSGNLVAESGAYGPIGRTVLDRNGVSHQVESLLDPSTAVLYEVEPAMDQAWAAALTSIGYPAGLALTYDRMTDAVTSTLGSLAASAPGTKLPTFHFVLNDAISSDTRIPPYGLDHDEALRRSATPVPETLYGAPGVGGTYEHWDERVLPLPAGATRAVVRLYYQQSSWEYLQFLWLANRRRDPFLKDTGINVLDAWLNTGQSAPFEMASVTLPVRPGPLRVGKHGIPIPAR